VDSNTDNVRILLLLLMTKLNISSVVLTEEDILNLKGTITITELEDGLLLRKIS